MNRNVDDQFTTYQELVWYLVRASVTAAPELWIKLDDMRQIPNSRFHWEYRRGSKEIEASEIFVISTINRNDYMVAVVHEGDKESPVVLGKYPPIFNFLH
jgi:hypothetical protein